jgi:hypothetical protein
VLIADPGDKQGQIRTRRPAAFQEIDPQNVTLAMGVKQIWRKGQTSVGYGEEADARVSASGYSWRRRDSPRD